MYMIMMILREGVVCLRRGLLKIYETIEWKHRRLAKRGSPATAGGCGELWRALLAAAVADCANYAPLRQNFVKDLRAIPCSEVPVRHPPRAGPGFMPSPARLTPVRSACKAPSVRRCMTRRDRALSRHASGGPSSKFFPEIDWLRNFLLEYSVGTPLPALWTRVFPGRRILSRTLGRRSGRR